MPTLLENINLFLFNISGDTETKFPVIIKEKTDNKKTGPVSVTMASQATCPTTCPWFRSGCYAESGPMGIHTKRLTNNPITDPLAISYAQARGVLGLSGKSPLRLNIVGDFPTDECVEIIGQAAEEYSKKCGSKVWAYTHAITKRKHWKNVSVLRSCENLEQVEKAFEDGFAAALVVKEFIHTKAYKLNNNLIGIPCPQQNGKTENCKSCKLCFNDNYLRENRKVILFASHGTAKKKMLTVLQ